MNIQPINLRRRPFINRLFRSPYTFWLHYKVGVRYGHPFSENVRIAWMLTRVGLKS